MAGCFIFAAFLLPSSATATSGGAGLPTPQPSPPPPPVAGVTARLSSDGRTAVPPAAAPEPVKQAIYSANEITRKPYVYGGGHGRFRSRGYDCSGAVSYALHGGEMLLDPLDSSDLMQWGETGKGMWITVYTNPGHAFVVVAGLRFDTSGLGEKGPRWRVAARSSRGFTARHPDGL